MNDTADLKVQHKCLDCHLRGEHFFCDLPEDMLARFESMKVTKVYRKGSMLFIEGQPAKGIYMLCQGRVKLSTCSLGGRVVILNIASAGEVLGLSAVMTETEYECSAEALELIQVNFISRSDFLTFLHDNPQASLNAVRQLSHNYRAAYEKVCSLALSGSAADKLAKLLLSWGNNGDSSNGTVYVKDRYTHEEMAEMIGTSRETVTRTLKHFRERKLIAVSGSDLTILDTVALRASIGTRQ